MAASIQFSAIFWIKHKSAHKNEELTFKNVPTLVAKGTNENFKSVQYYFIKINLNTLDSGPELTILFFSFASKGMIYRLLIHKFYQI